MRYGDCPTTSHYSASVLTRRKFQETWSTWSPVSSPGLLARLERMVGVNQGERVRLVIRRAREDTGLDIADIGK